MSAVRRWPKSEVMDPLSIKVARMVGNSMVSNMASNMASKGREAIITPARSKGRGRGRAVRRVSSGISIKAINRVLTAISLQADPVSRVITL